MAAELISGRRARMTRTTSESDVHVEMDLDGTGRAEISTSVPFYDHMLTALSRLYLAQDHPSGIVAGAVLASLPVVLVYLSLQRQLIGGLTSGSVK